MLFIVRFFDNQDKAFVRRDNLSKHLDWLKLNGEKILVAGSLRNEPGDNPLGALWIVEANSKSDINDIIKSDPFWICGLRDSYEILHWSKAFNDLRVPV
jgi:uncharacterized protein